MNISSDGENPAVDEWISKLDNLLMQSKIEQQFYDFKIEIHNIDANPMFNQKCLSKIIKTLTTNENDAKKFQAVFNSASRVYNGFHITGVQEEIRLKYQNADQYFSNIKDLIKQEPIAIKF